ncbi:MAG: LLM class flavin-dependent oxidoreductase [Streptosporangiaceae bacterium]|nr:LLM class flavin-dependent oxidoreductase [Streptosporangiaceae bacterium]
MKIDLFNEIQDPRPWTEGHEHLRFLQAVEQAELADKLGYGCWWEVEHHGGEEFSLSSAPEIMLAAISQRTRRIRLGHSAVLAPGAINHPVRAAERAATLDHLSGGRLEVGLTRSTAPEWRLFGVDPAEVVEQTEEAFQLVPKLWTNPRVTHRGRFYHLDGVSVVPKPYQQPHPPLWQAAASPASFGDAGRRGVGVLGTTLWEPLDYVERMVRFYRDAVAQCDRSVGAYVNNQIAYFTFVHCADTDEQAVRDGAAAAAAWYTVTALTFFEAAAAYAERFAQEQKLIEDPSGGGLTGQFLRGEAAFAAPNDAQLAIASILQGQPVPEDKLYDVLYAQGSLIVGSQQTCREKLTAYADLGIDRLMTFQQVAALPHDSVMRSIQLIGELIPEFDAA